jgi:hypothetical protein
MIVSSRREDAVEFCPDSDMSVQCALKATASCEYPRDMHTSPELLLSRDMRRKRVRLFATGHSRGGGYAQRTRRCTSVRPQMFSSMCCRMSNRVDRPPLGGGRAAVIVEACLFGDGVCSDKCFVAWPRGLRGLRSAI